MIRKAIYDERRAAEQQFYNQKVRNIKISNQLEMNHRLLISLHVHTHTQASVLEYSENNNENNNHKNLSDIITVVFRSDSKAIKSFIVTNERMEIGELRM